ncbi:hypothetical protein ACD591_15735 [Rufibacter glacialis]|uniref:PorV/PorQ family protein n=1 Tax=Rufibacter glacialis TaxID=1259555 RepID=A0A5M8QN06_9BACT|nr:hypothetical protein [Rufibacter glacialis]KAA6437597.1 hypothetical protein FOE74_03605 [Rufibacter glacialis]GGK57970.1 hypothetical protein GCM10011405_02550 [Rufibacter glacialis]
MTHALRICLLLYVLAVPLSSLGQLNNSPVGARALGLGGASVTLPEVWALSNNPAGIATLKNPVAGAYAHNLFLLKELSTVGLLAISPVPRVGVVGVDVQRFGGEAYNEQRLGLGVAHQLGVVRLGLKADLLQVRVKEWGSRKAVALSLGLQSDLVPGLTFGAHIYNLNQAKLAQFQDERVPTVMKLGLGFQAAAKVLLVLEAEKELEYPAAVKGGVEYRVVPALGLRTGFHSGTRAGTAGVDVTFRQFQVAYAVGAQHQLGMSNYLSVAYVLAKEKLP